MSFIDFKKYIGKTNTLMMTVLECHPVLFMARTSVPGQHLMVPNNIIAIYCLLLWHKLEDDTMVSGCGTRQPKELSFVENLRPNVQSQKILCSAL